MSKGRARTSLEVRALPFTRKMTCPGDWIHWDRYCPQKEGNMEAANCAPSSLVWFLFSWGLIATFYKEKTTAGNEPQPH